MMEKLNQIHASGGGKGDGQKKKTSVDKKSNDAKQNQEKKAVLLRFEDGTTDEVDLLIGADGVSSVVARQYLSTTFPANNGKIINGSCDEAITAAARPNHLGIFLILGISNHFHPHIDERGFYTLDGTHRLFIMPFKGSKLDDDDDDNTQTNPQQRRTMWQLSFPITSNEEEGMRMKQMSQCEMKQEVLKRIGHWHDPVLNLLKDTPLETIWGTSLQDRDPQIFMDKRKELEMHGRIPSRVVLTGDAAHSMSPFKGQGANQALADGPLLANWLRKSNIDSAVRGYMTEMTRRSGIKVCASRESAKKLYSDDCWEWMVQQDKPPGGGGDNNSAVIMQAVFHGVQARHVTTLLTTLEERKVNASLGAKLDETIRGIIQELNIAEDAISKKSPTDSHDASNTKQLSYQEMAQLQSRALEYSLTGNISDLRQLSQKSHLIIPNALNSHKRTCLHLAAMNDHVNMCRWLLSEVSMDCNALDIDGKGALDLAVDNGRDETVRLLKKWLNRIEDDEAYCDDSKKQPEKGEEDDIYRGVEQQLRGIQTMDQLRSLLQRNRDCAAENKQAITHVLGFHVDESDVEYNKQCMNVLAEEHGAVLLKNFISGEVDQLALGALALRPLNFDASGALEKLRAEMKDDECFKSITEIGSSVTTTTKLVKKRLDKCIEEVKSQLTIPADSSVAVQTNFWPQIQQAGLDQQQKKQKIDSFPLSRLRYLNLGELNYNWGVRRYEKVNGAEALPDRLISLAQQAHEVAKLSSKEECTSPVSFDMAICNLYHLQRPSDRLGGHRDNVESNLSLPLVTFSLGAPGIFLLSGTTRATKPTAILLEPGDCMIMSGKSRRYFHGVPTNFLLMYLTTIMLLLTIMKQSAGAYSLRLIHAAAIPSFQVKVR